MLIKILFEFNRCFKLQNVVKSRIHFNTCQPGAYIWGEGRGVGGGTHNRMYFCCCCLQVNGLYAHLSVTVTKKILPVIIPPGYKPSFSFHGIEHDSLCYDVLKLKKRLNSKSALISTAT